MVIMLCNNSHTQRRAFSLSSALFLSLSLFASSSSTSGSGDVTAADDVPVDALFFEVFSSAGAVVAFLFDLEGAISKMTMHAD